MESKRVFSSNFDISLPQKGVKYDTPMHVGPAAFRLLTSPRLLDVVESIVGPEVYSNPVQHIRTKLPPKVFANGAQANGLVSKVEWHQDNGVVLPEADEATILTVWLPLTDATEQNGCMQVIPRSHRDGLKDHCPVDQLRIPDALLPLSQATPVPMKAGSALLMNQQTVHSSMDNVTEDQVRISFDLRYQPVGQPTGRPLLPRVRGAEPIASGADPGRPEGLGEALAGHARAAGPRARTRRSTAGARTRRSAPDRQTRSTQRSPHPSPLP